MSVTYQDVLEAVCSEVGLVNANDTQHIFAISTTQEAKLAYDILAAHGFDVRLYPEANTSKFYITHTTNTDNNSRLASALHYAQTLRQLLDTLPQGTDFNMAFANTSTQGKQISIYFPPPATAAVTQQPAPAVRPVQVPSSTAAPAASYSTNKSGKKVRYRVKESDLLRAGPELGKKYPFGIPSASDNANEMSVSKWFSTYIFSNFTESFYSFIGMAFFTLILISLWVVLKGYLCPDLATVKNRNWYCVD